MRPINRGSVPLVNGNPRVVTDYKDWRKALIDRIGPYCCYCNMPLSDALQVEHVIAQDIDPALALSWDNMLLACGPCNRSKSAQPCPPITHYLPQFHNTHLAFAASGISLHPRVPNASAIYLTYRGAPALAAKANNTIQLCKLDQDTTRNIQQATDLRWKFRFDAFVTASEWRFQWNNWGHTQAQPFTQLLISAARAIGFWGVWFDIFADVPDIRKALVEDFPGTAINCFDAQFQLVGRNPQNLQDTL